MSVVPIGIFWDIENCSVPSNVAIREATDRIRRFVGSFKGEIKSFCIYGAPNCFQKFTTDDLETNTIIQIEQGTKDAADKRMLVDMCMFLYDHGPSIITLISSDMDFFYSLGKLRERGCETIVIHGRNVKANISEYTNYHSDWFKLVRGISNPVEPTVMVNWYQKLETVLDKLLYSDQLKISEKSVRAAMGLDGGNRDPEWQQISSREDFKALLTSAISQQESLVSFDPTNAKWDNFTIAQLTMLYATLLECAGIKKNGKYPLALHFKSVAQKLYPAAVFPIAQILEFIELSFKTHWISHQGGGIVVETVLLRQFPFAEIFHGQPGEVGVASPATGKKKIAISTDHAKSALQYYFQKLFKTLPKYECIKSGEDHLPTFEISVQVFLPPGKFRDQYFYATATSSSKKTAEKLAAKNACNTIINRYLSDFEFPSDFLDPDSL